jgi:HTH-type transcriptional regulator / antitoxin HigA
MEIKPLKTEADYEAALAEIAQLMEAEPDTPEGDRLDVLVTLAEAWEAKHFPIAAPDPIEVIKHRMEAQGLTRRDLEPMLGSRSRVSEVLSRRRPLSLTMIRRLSRDMRIPADLLIQPYALKNKPHTPGG